MGNRYWLWLAVRLGVGVALIAWAASYIGAGNGEKEFQLSLDAMKQVKTFRVAYTASPGTQHNEMLWEVDCARDVVHHQSHFTDTSVNPPANNSEDYLMVGGLQYLRQDGAWVRPKYYAGGQSAKWFCQNLAQGTDSSILPQIATMIRRGILQKGDKKTVNGVRCREWQVAMKGAPSGLEHDTVCLGLEDHLPYEMTVDWMHSRASFSDYNAPLQLDVLEAAVQSTSASTN